MFNTSFNSFQCFCFVVALAHLPQCTLFAPPILHNPLFFISPGYYSRPKRNCKQGMLIQNFGGANKVHCGRCASSVYFLCYISHFPFLFSHFDTSHIICIPNPLYSLASSREPLFTHLI